MNPMNRTSLSLAFLLCLGLAPLVQAADQAPAPIQLPAKDLDKKFLVAIAPVNVDGTVNVVVDQPAAKGKKGGRAIAIGRIPRSILAKEKGGNGEALLAYLPGSAAPVGATVRGRALALITRTLAGKSECRVVVVPMDGLYGPYLTLTQIEQVAPGFLADLKAGFGPAKEGASFAEQGRKDTVRFVGDAISDFEGAYIKESDKRPLDKNGNPMLYKWPGARNIGE
jgi:inorganic pyrophosphatase